MESRMVSMVILVVAVFVGMSDAAFKCCRDNSKHKDKTTRLNLKGLLSLEGLCMDTCSKANLLGNLIGTSSSVTPALQCLLGPYHDGKNVTKITQKQACMFPCILELNLLDTCDVQAIITTLTKSCPCADLKALCVSACLCCGKDEDPLDICVNLCLSNRGISLNLDKNAIGSNTNNCSELSRPFFVRTHLPYKVKRLEKVVVSIQVFNTLEYDQEITVTLEHNSKSGYEFVKKPGSENQWNEQWNTRVITVPKNSSAVTNFPIVCTIAGVVKILVTATGDTGSDEIETPLLVEPDGYPVYKTKPCIFELSKATNILSMSVKLDIPADAVPGSASAEFTINSDLMAPVLANLDQLIRMPFGCGEQNMMMLVPMMAATLYLNITRRLTPALEETAKRYMEAGYKSELKFKCEDYSYSVWYGRNSTIWLTAFVTRSFKQAEPCIFINATELELSLEYLKSQQKPNGVFVENGFVIHGAMQGGSAQAGIGLTAFVLLSFLENDVPNDAALNFLEQSLDKITNDPYLLALVTYALHLGKSAKKDQAWNYLQGLVIENDGMKHLNYTARGAATQPTWWDAPRPVDIEATAYALLTYVLRNEIAEAVPIVRWLASKRNALGGFSSTQETVVALQGLAAYAAKVYSNATDLSVTVTNGDTSDTFKIDSTNALVLQSSLMNNLGESVQIDVSGLGIAYAQVNYHYNMPNRNDPQPFVCTKTITEGRSRNLVVELCCHYALTGRSNMVLVEANSVSGYTMNQNDLNALTSITDLERVELEKGNSKANIYFNSLGSEKVCFNITQERTYSVAEQKPALIIVYDYYDPACRIEFEYSSPKPATLRDVCGDDCWAN